MARKRTGLIETAAHKPAGQQARPRIFGLGWNGREHRTHCGAALFDDRPPRHFRAKRRDEFPAHSRGHAVEDNDEHGLLPGQWNDHLVEHLLDSQQAVLIGPLGHRVMEQPPKRLSLSLLFLRDGSLERGDCVGELTGFSHTADRVAGPVNETPGGEVVVRGLDERFRSGRILPPRCQPAGQPHRHSQPFCFARAGVSEIVFLHPISRLKHRFDRGGLARGCRRKRSHGGGKGA